MLVFFLGYFYFGNCRWVTLYEKDLEVWATALRGMVRGQGL